MNQIGTLGRLKRWYVIGCLLAPVWVLGADAAPANIVAWGANDRGQSSLPGGLTNTTTAVLGVEDGFAVQDGTVVPWGNTNNAPTLKNFPTGLSNIVALATRDHPCLALRAGGAVVAWGDDSNVQVPDGLSNVVAIATGFAHSLALKNDGTVVAWGAGTFDAGDYPNFGQSIVPTGLSNVVAIAAGFAHSVALTADGRVVAWGATDGAWVDCGQSIVPADLQDVVSIAASYWCTMALTSKGKIIVWGDNTNGKTNVPSDLTNVVALAGGDDHHLALNADGTVRGWGLNYFGETDPPAGLSNVVWIAAGAGDSLAIFNDGSPSVVRAPFTQTALPGTDVTLRVAAVGQPPLTYQWLHDGMTVPAATNAFLSLTNIPLSAAGSYHCVVSNLLGSATSRAGVLSVPRTIPSFDTSSSWLGLSARGFGLPVKGLSGHGELVISASTNGVDWESILTNPPASGSALLFDSSANNLPARFYRAIER